MLGIGSASAILGMLVAMITIANPVFKLHSRIDLLSYRIEQLERKIDREIRDHSERRDHV